MIANYGKELRNFLSSNTLPEILVDLGGNAFESAVVDSNILIFSKQSSRDNKCLALDISDSKDKPNQLYSSQFESAIFQSDNIISIESKLVGSIRNKIIEKGRKLKDWELTFKYGIKTGLNEAFIISEDTKTKLIENHSSSENLIKPMLAGADISKYAYNTNEYLIKALPSLNLDIEEFPAIKTYLENFGEKLYQTGTTFIDPISGKKEKTRKKTHNNWFETQDTISYHELFKLPKIFYREISTQMNAVYVEEEIYVNNKVYLVTGEKLKYLTAYFNSNLFNYFLEKDTSNLGGKGEKYMNEIYVFFPNTEIEKSFSVSIDMIQNSYREKEIICKSLINYLNSQFNLEKPSKKLQNWHELTFADFIKELNKAIKAANRAAAKAAVIDLGDPSGQMETTPYQVIPELTKKDEFEWMELFEEKKKEVVELQSQINQTEKEIDQMVYELYGLTDEEIGIVEGS